MLCERKVVISFFKLKNVTLWQTENFRMSFFDASIMDLAAGIRFSVAFFE